MMCSHSTNAVTSISGIAFVEYGHIICHSPLCRDVVAAVHTWHKTVIPDQHGQLTVSDAGIGNFLRNNDFRFLGRLPKVDLII